MKMNKKIKVLGSAILMSLIMAGCGNNNSSNSPVPTVNNPQNPFGEGPAAVSLSKDGGVINPADLGSCGNYALLAETGITNTTGSSITGDIGISPYAAGSITNFGLMMDMSGQYSTAPAVTGRIFAANYAVPTPANLTSAIGCMETAYTAAAGRTNPGYTELGSGEIGSLTLAPGLYKWSSSVFISNTVTISGGANDVWIFQIAGDLIESSAKSVILGGQAQAKNIFWQVAGQVTIGTNSHFEGIILGKTAVHLQTNSSMNGRIYAQTMVTLDNATIVQP